MHHDFELNFVWHFSEGDTLRTSVDAAQQLWLSRFVERLAREIQPVVEEVQFKLLPRTKRTVNESDTGGWFAEIARLAHVRRLVTFEVWLDRYADPRVRRLYYGFGAYAGREVRELADAGATLFQNVRTRRDANLKEATIGGESILHLSSPLDEKELGHPFYSPHSGSIGYGVYASPLPPFSSKVEKCLLGEAKRFFLLVAQAYRTRLALGVVRGRSRARSGNTEGTERESLAALHGSEGQGNGLGSEERRAVEHHAYAVAQKVYMDAGWDVAFVGDRYSFDLLCRRRKERRWVEVKGTTGRGDSVLLTPHALKIAERHHPHADLCIVHSISLHDGPNGPVAAGGMIEVVEEWGRYASRVQPITLRWYAPDVEIPRLEPRDER